MSTKHVVVETQGDKILGSPLVSWFFWTSTTLYTYALFELVLRTEWWFGIDRFRIKGWAVDWLFVLGFSLNPFAIVLYALLSWWAESGVVKWVIRALRLVPIFYKVEVSHTVTLTRDEAKAYVAARDWVYGNFPKFLFQACLASLDFIANHSQMTANVRLFGENSNPIAWIALTFVTIVVVFIGEVLFSVQTDPRTIDESGLAIQTIVAGKEVDALSTNTADAPAPDAESSARNKGKPGGQ